MNPNVKGKSPSSPLKMRGRPRLSSQEEPSGSATELVVFVLIKKTLNHFMFHVLH